MPKKYSEVCLLVMRQVFIPSNQICSRNSNKLLVFNLLFLFLAVMKNFKPFVLELKKMVCESRLYYFLYHPDKRDVINQLK